MDIEKYMLPCASKSLFGLECLGCGCQRAFVLACQGQFKKALLLFPAIYTSILFFIFLFLLLLTKNKNRTKLQFTFSKIIIVLGVLNFVIMLVSFIAKHFISQ